MISKCLWSSSFIFPLVELFVLPFCFFIARPQNIGIKEWVPFLTDWLAHEWIITEHMNTESSHIVMQCCPLTRQVGKQGPEKDGLIKRVLQRWLEPGFITSSPYFYLPNICPLCSFHIPTDATWDQAHPSHLDGCTPPDCSICSAASPNTSSSASTWLPWWSSTMQIGSWFLKSFRCSHYMGDRVHTPSQDPHGRAGSDPWRPGLPLISLPLSLFPSQVQGSALTLTFTVMPLSTTASILPALSVQNITLTGLLGRQQLLGSSV